MLGLLDTVALAIWSATFSHPRPALLHGILTTEPGRGEPEAPDSLPAVLACVGLLAPEALARTLRDCAETALARGAAEGMTVVPWGDARYPPLLAAIPDPPLALWVKGQVDRLGSPAVAVVGSRAASPYGLEAATRLSRELAAAGMSIVSGLARGVDSAAHRGALAVDGVTLGVLGSGLDVVYPPEHARLAADMTVRGAVLSEYPPGTPPLPRYFPLRNRIISGLAIGVVVVEAALGSGSLITANRAAEQGRHVMAVPGNVLSGRFRGSHALLRDGAKVVDGAVDVLEEVGNSSLRALCVAAGALEPEGDEVLRAMSPGETYDADTLGRQTGLQASVLLTRLLDLELRGAVRRVAGGRFVRAA